MGALGVLGEICPWGYGKREVVSHQSWGWDISPGIAFQTPWPSIIQIGLPDPLRFIEKHLYFFRFSLDDDCL